MIQRPAFLGVVLVAMALAAALPSRVAADAVVTSQSMNAPTIAEVFVTRDGIRVELEIGITDFAAFVNVLPVEILTRMGLGDAPLAERYERFYREDFVIRADGEILVPRLTSIEGKPRVRRDEITGEPLDQDGSDEPVLLVSLEYSFEETPATLALRPPGADREAGGEMATIGFVLYHEGLAVNDFRYLGLDATVDLDWEDPWYSRFRHPNLRRQYDAPLRGFLYAEPFEVRKEIIARPVDLQRWIDLGLEGKETLTPADRERILEQAAEFLLERCPVTIDGEPATGTLDRIHFVSRTLRQTRVIPEEEEIPAISATIGAVFVYPTLGLPQEASMEWDLFTERTREMRGIATDEAGGLPITVTPEEPVLTWKNYLKNPTTPTLVEVAAPPEPRRFVLPVTLVVAGGILFGLVRGRSSATARSRRVAWVLVGLSGILAFLPWTWVRIPLPGGGGIDPGQSTPVVEGLLTNIYRAFDYREESDIYDTLERSVSGDLLTEVYLEVRRALRLESQGGARTKVKELDLVAAEVDPEAADSGFVVTAEWTVLGAVGHWGHIHTRRNRYEAVLTIEPVEGAWKLTRMQLLDEERL